LPGAFFAVRQLGQAGSRGEYLFLFVANGSLAAAKRDGTRESEGYSSRSEALALC
jgi:hypothetical protein